MRIFIALFFLFTGVFCFGKDLLNSSDWQKNGTAFPKDWIAFTYRGASDVVLVNGKIARISSKKNGSGYIGKRSKCDLPAGSVVRVTGRYRTAGLELAKNGFIRGNVNFNPGAPVRERRAIGFNLKPSKDWKSFSYERLLDVPVKSFFAFFQMYKGNGSVEFTDLQVAVADKKADLKNALMIWREAENSMTGGSLSNHGRKIPGYFSGRGGYFINSGKLTYRFSIASEVDTRTLLPLKRKYYIWGRVYGYRDRPSVKVLLDRRPIYSFRTENREKLVNGHYNGTYYWQRLGSFETAGRAAELVLESTGRMFVDALLFTDSAAYTPKAYEGRDHKQSKLFTDLKMPVMLTPSYRTNSISPDVVSAVRLQFVTPGNRAVIKKGTVLVKLPKGVQLKQVNSHWAGRDWKAHSRVPDVLRVKTTREADGGQLCRIEMSYISLSVVLYLQADPSLKGPVALKYSFEMAGGKQPWDSLPLQIVSIPGTTGFKTIRIGAAGQSFRGFYSDYPGLFELCRHTGVNLLNPWHLYPRSYPQLWKDFSKRAAQAGVKIYGEYSPRLGTPPAEERATRLDGKKDRHPTILPRPQSPWVKKDLDKIAELARYVDTIVLDDENTNGVGDLLDYSPDVLKAFAEYRKERNLPALKISVQELVRKKKAYPAEYARWVDFKCEMMSRHYELYRKAARRYNPKAEVIPQIIKDNSTKALRENSYWDYRKLLRHTKRISPMIYTYQGICDSGIVGDTMHISNREAGKPVTIPTLLVEHPGVGQILPAEKPMYKYQIWECLMEKADHVLFWDASAFFNPVNLQYISEGIRIAAPYEKFFLNGVPTKVKAPAWVRAKALRLGKQILVYAANYRNAANKTATVVLPDGQKVTVKFDCDIAGFYLIDLK